MSEAAGTTGAETLWVVGLGGVDQSVLNTVSEAVTEQLPFDVRHHPDPVGTDGLSDESIDEPYDGVTLARYAALQADRDAVLAVTDIDIEHPDGDTSYGISVLDGSLAAVSTARLGDPDDERFDERLRKEAVAHSAHLLGLSNCWREGCVLRRADMLSELDALEETPCESCRADIEAATEVEAAERTERDSSTASNAESGNAVTHDLARTARFWRAIVTYGFSLLLVFLAVGGALNITGTSFPESDAVAFFALLGMLVLAWLVYRRLRRGLGWLWHRFRSTVFGLV